MVANSIDLKKIKTEKEWLESKEVLETMLKTEALSDVSKKSWNEEIQGNSQKQDFESVKDDTLGKWSTVDFVEKIDVSAGIDAKIEKTHDESQTKNEGFWEKKYFEVSFFIYFFIIFIWNLQNCVIYFKIETRDITFQVTINFNPSSSTFYGSRIASC